MSKKSKKANKTVKKTPTKPTQPTRVIPRARTRSAKGLEYDRMLIEESNNEVEDITFMESATTTSGVDAEPDGHEQANDSTATVPTLAPGKDSKEPPTVDTGLALHEHLSSSSSTTTTITTITSLPTTTTTSPSISTTFSTTSVAPVVATIAENSINFPSDIGFATYHTPIVDCRNHGNSRRKSENLRLELEIAAELAGMPIVGINDVGVGERTVEENVVASEVTEGSSEGTLMGEFEAPPEAKATASIDLSCEANQCHGNEDNGF